MNQDGQSLQALAAAIDIQGAPDWSPDGRSIAAAGRDAAGTGLFAIPVDGGAPRRLASAPSTDPDWLATDPAWSPNGDFLVYSGQFSGATASVRTAGAPLRAVRSDGTKYISRSRSGKPRRVRPSGSVPVVTAFSTRPISCSVETLSRGTSGFSISSPASNDNSQT